MNLEKFTNNSKAAVRDSHALTLRRNHQLVEPEHMFRALVDDSAGLISRLFEKMESGCNY